MLQWILTFSCNVVFVIWRFRIPHTHAACPAHPGFLEMISMILAAVIWDADDPCSVKTQNRLLHRSTTRPLYFWCFASNSAFFKWQMSISGAKWTLVPDVLASSITSDLLVTFVRFHRRKSLQIFPFLVHRCFRCRNIHSLRHRNKFVNQVVCCNEFSPTSCNMVFMMIR